MIVFFQHHHSMFWLVVGVVVVGQYLVRCAIWPFAKCWACRGQARRYQNKRTKKAWRNCRVCKGTGQRLRVGRRLWAYFAKAREKGTVSS